MKFKFIVNILLLLVSGGFLGLGVIFLFYVFTPLPNIEIQNIDSRQSIILEDRSGEFLFDFSKMKKGHTSLLKIYQKTLLMRLLP